MPNGTEVDPRAETAAPARTLGVRHSPFTVGQVLPLRRRAAIDGLRRLSALLQHGIPATAAQSLRDPRIPDSEWPRILARELAMTLGWATRRSRALTGHIPVAAWDSQGRVLVLLPAHGHAVHMIRRALPFALCGVTTTVIGHEHDRQDAGEMLAVVSELVGLPSGTLTLCQESAKREVGRLAPEDLVVLTGHPETAVAVRGSTAAQVLGATGGCTVLTGTEPDRVRRTAALLRAHDRPDSCTRLGGWWTDSGQASDAPMGSGPPSLRDIHPSAVYRLTDSLDSPPHEHDGYTVLPCDDDGVVGTLTGFARDPLHHWPGDFLL